MPGPLPTPNPRRRNAPTIPTTSLPASGRSGKAPRVPSWVTLGKAGRAWWRWAWKTPSAAAWGAGMENIVARRAALEDDLAALAEVEGLDLIEVANGENVMDARRVVSTVAQLATGRLQIMRHMVDLEDRLGLSPKAMAAMRWTIVDDSKEDDKATTERPSNVRRLKVADPHAVAGA